MYVVYFNIISTELIYKILIFWQVRLLTCFDKQNVGFLLRICFVWLNYGKTEWDIVPEAIKNQ